MLRKSTFWMRPYANKDNAYMCDVDDGEKMFEYVCRAFDNTEAIKVISTPKQLQSLQKLFFKNQNQKKRIIQFRPSMHQSNRNSTRHHIHPEERIWAGRTPRAPDAPKLKHDKMKQFYMIDMERKMW